VTPQSALVANSIIWNLTRLGMVLIVVQALRVYAKERWPKS
jgi:hypothetical protein